MRFSVKAFGAVALCATLAGCAAGARARRGMEGDAREKLYSVLWWKQVSTIDAVPFRPLELAPPSVEPESGKIVVATSDGRLHLLAPGGAELWQSEEGVGSAAGPLIAGERIYTGAADGELQALDATTGAKLWSYTLGEELATQPALGGGMLFVMTTSEVLHALDAESGAWKWQYRREPPGSLTMRGAARPLYVDGALFVGFADGNAAALNALDGSVKWMRQLASKARFLDVDAGPVYDGMGTVFFGAVSTGVFALDAATGTIRWTLPLKGVGSLVGNDASRVLYVGGAGLVGAFGMDDGVARWSRDLGAGHEVTALSRSGKLLLASTGEGALLFIDTASGRVRQSFNPGRGVGARVAVEFPGELSILSNRGYLYRFAIETGPN